MAINSFSGQVTFGDATPGQRLPCLLVLDTSGSMAQSSRIDALNKGLIALRECLDQDDVARITAEVAVLTFDSKVDLIHDFALAPDFEPPTLTAQGLTFMGRAIIEGIDLIEERKRLHREAGRPYLRPIMILLTDGHPEGEEAGVLDQAKAKVRKAVADRRFRLWPICVGEDIDPAELAEITGTDALRLNETKWGELFIWIPDGLKSASRSTSEDAPINLAPPSWSN
jgi:uncharacterized protein YegL